MRTLSVVMVGSSLGAPLWLAVESALREPECHELIVVDNGLPPGAMVTLKQRGENAPRLKLITSGKKAGFAEACNQGARASTGELLLLLSPDCMLHVGALALALDAFRAYPEDTLAGCRLLNPDGSQVPEPYRDLLATENVVPETLELARFFKNIKPLGGAVPVTETPYETAAISGAFMLLSRRSFDRFEGLAERYFMRLEGADLCMRIHKAGGKVVLLPQVKAIQFHETDESIHPVKSVPDPAASRLALIHRMARFEPQDASLAGKTILVAGGSGQVGLCVVGKALARGARVVATYNRHAVPFTHPRLEWVQRDLTKTTLAGLGADILVYMLSLWTLPDMLGDIEASGIRRVVAYGSTSRFSKVGSKSKYEQRIVEMLTWGEEQSMRLAAEKGMEMTILRPTMIYGVGLDANIMRLSASVRRFGFLAVHGRAGGMRNPVQAPDLAQAALDAAFNPASAGKCYNLGGGSPMSYRDMLLALFQYLGKKPRVIPVPFMPLLLDVLGGIFEGGRVNGEMARRMNQDLLFDMKDAIDDFGYQPKGFLEGYVVI